MKTTFETFAKINDRHYRVVRNKARISPYPDPVVKEEIDTSPPTNDFYSEQVIMDMEDNDEITSNESAFMRGFLSA